MTFETITVGEADGVVTLTLNRPDKLNALSVAMGEELCAALEALGRSTSARVLVVTGAGRMFSAGGDLSSMDQVVGSAAAIDHSVRIYCEVARRLRELPLPAVAKLNGDAPTKTICFLRSPISPATTPASASCSPASG